MFFNFSDMCRIQNGILHEIGFMPHCEFVNIQLTHWGKIMSLKINTLEIMTTAQKWQKLVFILRKLLIYK
jgi:hypothetical protein